MGEAEDHANVATATAYQRLLPQGLNLIQNLPRLAAAHHWAFEPHLLDGLPVILCGAGPSLDRGIDALRRAQDHAVIVAVNTSAPALNARGIRVDAVCSMESLDVSAHMRDAAAYAGSAWLDIASHANTWAAAEQLPILAYHGRSVEAWAMTLTLNAIPLEHGGAVTTAAAAIALGMGCERLILIGCDFGFAADGRVYASDAGWGDERVEIEPELDDQGREWLNFRGRLESKHKLVEEGSGVKMPDRRTFYWVRGWGDTKIASTMDYITQLRWFESLRDLNPHAKMVNASEGGAFIQGLHHMTMAEAVSAIDRAPRAVKDPSAVYLARLIASQTIGSTRADAVRDYIAAAVDDVAKVSEAVLMGTEARLMPWLFDSGCVEPFCCEEKIELMAALEQGHEIPPLDQVVLRHAAQLRGVDVAREVLAEIEPEGGCDD